MKLRRTVESGTRTVTLRRRALETLQRNRARRFRSPLRDPEALLHELEVHQVELEMQNEELRAAQSKLETSRARYADLYDFAPVGYFNFDQRGRVLEVNLTGVRLLGMERQHLMKLPFVTFVARESRSAFLLHLRQVFKCHSRQLCELRLRRAANTPFYVQLESVAGSGQEDVPYCRTAVTDVTDRKKAEDGLRKAHEELELRVQQRTAELSKTNRDLEDQILQRQRAEKALKETHQELELRVQQRTAELWQTNRALEAEIVQRKRAEEARLHALRHLVEAQEAERGRVARELHDELGQQLAALSLGLNRFTEELPADSPLRSRLPGVLNTVDGLLRGMHNLAWTLRHPALDDLGLATALRRYATEWEKLSGISVDFHSRGLDKRRLPAQMETTLYRIAQEALTNVFKHAQARRVSVLLESHRRHAALIVEDDGRGFQAEELLNGSPVAQGHLGLAGMSERAALVGGTVAIESSPGSGTTVFARIPFAEEPVQGT